MIRHLKFVTALIVWCFCLGLILGCGKKSVDAVPRVSNSKPVFGGEVAAVFRKKSGDLNFGFVHADHFACFSINVKQILSCKELDEVSWEFWESWLAEHAGQENAKLELIERVWLLLDRESVSMAMDGSTDGLLVTVIDYQSELDLDQLALANSISASGESDSLVTLSGELGLKEKAAETPEQRGSGSRMFAKAISKKRIVIGSRQLISKLKSAQQTSGLARQLSRLDFSADVEGIVTAGPIRETLKSVFGVAAQFGWGEVKKFAFLPDVLEQIEFRMSIGENDSDALLSLKAMIDDRSMIEQIVRTAQQAAKELSSSAGEGGLSGIGMIFGSGSPKISGEPATVYPLKTTKIAEQFALEIKDNGLFAVEGAQGHVAFRLGRPAQTSELIQAIVSDSQRAAEFETRVANMNRIAKAMKRYHEKYGCFPPPGGVQNLDSSDKNSLPSQLNWRVGLLPFLGEQKLYEQFNFEQKWNSKVNLKVATSIPEVFSVKHNGVDPVTRFHLPGGKLGLFADWDAESDAEPKKLADIADRKLWTAIVVEGGPDDDVIWTKPGVIRLNKDSVSEPGNPLGRADESGVLMASASFEPRVVRHSPVAVMSVLTAQGGEKLTTRDFFSMPGN